MTVDHSLILSFIDQSIAITWTRPNLWIIAHALPFKIHKWLHRKHRKVVTRVTTVGVDVVQTTLPHGPDQPPESSLNTDVTVSFVRHVLCASYNEWLWPLEPICSNCLLSVSRCFRCILEFYYDDYYASPYFDSVCFRQCRRHWDILPLLSLVIMFNESRFFGDLSQVFLNRILTPTVGAKDGTLTLRAVTLMHPKRFFGNKL